jgi:hypothetical protein
LKYAVVDCSTSRSVFVVVMSTGNVRLHPFYSGAAALMRACPERAERVEWETSLALVGANRDLEILRDFSTSVEMTEMSESRD